MERPGILSTSGIFIFIAFMTLAVFFQTQAHEFVTTGDSWLIYNNPHIKNGINKESLKWAFSPDRDGVRMPLTQLSYILDYKFHRLNPTWYHLENVFIHILNSLLLFLILKRATLKVLRSAFAAALFALHPINAGTVAWAAGRSDILSVSFFLLAIAAYMYYLRKPGIIRYAFIIFFFITAIFSNPIAAVLPAALLLFDFWPLRRTENVRISSLIKDKLPLFSISGLTGLIALVSFISKGSVATSDSISLLTRIGYVPVSYTSYFSRFLLPLNFSALYPYPSSGFDIWKTIAAIVVLTILSYFIIKASNRFKFLIAGWMWFIVLMIPSSGFFNRSFEVMSDRYAYLPFIGLFVSAAWGAPELFDRYFARFKYKYLNYFCIGILVILAFISHNEVSYWKTSITLYERSSKSIFDNYLAFNSLGEAVEDKGNPGDAVIFYRKAMAANPYYYLSFNNLGKALLKTGKTADALEVFDKALKLNPDSPQANYYLGYIMLDDGNEEQAEIYFKHALEVKPDYLDAMTGLGIIELKRNNAEGALASFRKVLNTDPSNAGGYKQTGLIYFKTGNKDSAEIYLRKALTLNTWDAETHLRLGELLDQKGNKQEARHHYLEALRIDPEYRFAVEKIYE